MTKLAGLFAVSLLALSACKSDKKEGEGGAAKSTATQKGAKGGDASALLTGTAPTLPAEVAAVKFGQPKADALKAVGADSGYVSSKTNDKVSYNLRFTNDEKVEEVSMSARDSDLTALATKQWGEPMKTKKELFWFNPETATRASIDPKRPDSISFDAYEPHEKLLGDKGFELAHLAGKPMLGATLDELHAAWKDRLCKWDEEGTKLKNAFAEWEKDSIKRVEHSQMSIRFCTPVQRGVDTFSGLGDQIRIGEDGKVASYHISWGLNGSAELLKQLTSFFDTKFGGKPVEVKDGSSVERYYFDPAGKNRARVSITENHVGLEVSKYMPVAELIGGDKPGLSIEGAHMPGGTFEQIKADDPEHFRQHGTLAALYYPPTEFDGKNLDVDLLFYSGDKKTYGYRVNLFHKNNEAAGDEVFELLKKKFGEPKADKKSTDKDKYWNFSKNGRKVNARRVSQTWQITVTK